jgi:endo-alpha-N-acetylgalactosaminidase
MTKKILISLTFILLCFVQLNAQGNQVKLIKSNQLELTVDPEFPLIKKYRFLEDGAELKGNISNKKEVLINGEIFQPNVKSTVQSSSIIYKLDINEIDVSISIKIEVNENIVDFKMTDIEEKGDVKVNTIAFPNHEIIRITSIEKNASFAGSKMFTSTKGHDGDVFQKLNQVTPIDTIPQGFLFGFLSNDVIAASIWSNAVEEKTDNGRILKQTIKNNGISHTSVWSGSWLYRANKMETPSELPQMKVILARDMNSDQKIDWQDGAIAFRKIMNNPFGSERVKNWVVFRIPMNFASQATNPFFKSLDETKRIFLHTDGLGQFAILKGYGGEGHDSNHPDYGHIGTRQGGVKGINLICDEANKYNTDIGVHINGTESYPEASIFSESLIDKQKKGWNWLDQSYRIDKRNDAINDNRLERLKSLKRQIPNLDFIYLDVWYAKGGWDSRKVAKEINDLGLILTTEFPQDLEYNAVWNHWAVDYKYGGKTIKGFNSQIARFIRNHQKDTWIAKHPLLGGAEMVDFEGWQGRINYDKCIDITFEVNLLTKYLQFFPILNWKNNSIQFENKVAVSNESGKRVITKDGIVVSNGDSYLLPWNPVKEEKLYHWNSLNGTTTWKLPNSWNQVKSIYLYRLTDLGRTLETEIPVINQMVTINAIANTPYVLYKKEQPENQITSYGEGTLIKNGSFNTGNTKDWNVLGNSASVVRDSLGQYALQIKASKRDIEISQDLQNLSKGSYCAETYVQTSGGRKATLVVQNDNTSFESYTTSSIWKNYIAADEKHGTNMQRMYTFFDIDDYHENAQVQLKIAGGDSTVIFDNIRVYKHNKSNAIDSLYFYENFEHIPNGIYPFVKGPAGGANDPRVHLSEKHSPYTQKGWSGKIVDDVLNGNWSLKIHENATGIIIQTIPQNLRFEPNKRYKVSFNYQSEKDGYSFVLGNNAEIIFESKINLQQKTQIFEFMFTGSTSGNSWFGIKKTDGETSDFILDDLKVMEIKK